MDPVPPASHDGAGADEGHRNPLRAAVGLVGVLVCLVAVLWILGLTSNDGEGDRGAGDSPEAAGLVEAPTTSSPVRDVVESDPAETPSIAVPDDAGPFSPLEGRLAYLSGNRVAVVDLASGAVASVPIGLWGSISPFADFELLNDGFRTVGVNLRADPPQAVLIASSAVLAPAEAPLVDYWVITRPNGPNGAVQLAAWHSYGAMSGALLAPAGSQLLMTGDSGVLIVPPVGETFRPTIAGFEMVSEHRVLGAAGTVRIEQSCDEQLSCVVAGLDTDSGTEFGLPDDFVAELAEISVSADGRWLLNDTSPAWLFDRRAQALRLLEVGGFGQAQWSAESASVVWLTTDRTPTLVLAQLDPVDDEPGWIVVELAGLGADPVPGSSFLLESAVFDPALS